MRRFAAVAAAFAVGASAWGASGPAPVPATAVFAGGCFWSSESAFEKVYGVIDVVSGYTGGTTKNPNYGNYARGGHVEAVKVTYDANRVSYAELLEIFWRSVDPADGGGQFYDRGPSYRTVIYWKTDAEKAAAEASKAALARSGRFPKPIATEIAKESPFYPAEEHHQDYTRKNPLEYERYRVGSGRDAFFTKTWGTAYAADSGLPPAAKDGTWKKPPVAELRKKLTQLQFAVTQTEGTEPAFMNQYHDNKAEGIYVDVVSGEPLFSSTDKYDSGTGWPSFTRPLVPANVVERTDTGYGMVRVEVRSRWADSHLGHLFDDGPAPTNLRYCMNSASLRFIPVADLEKEGYGKYLKLFAK